MWEREEFETLSPKRLSQLQSTGAIWPELTHEIATELERRPHPHVACFFQLPYPMHVGSEWALLDEVRTYALQNDTHSIRVFQNLKRIADAMKNAPSDND